MKRAAVGAVVIGFYVIAVAVTRVPVRPLYDGVAPQPYQWVSSPPGFSNKKPKPFAQNVEIGEKGSVGANVQTVDGQAVLILPEGSFAKHRGDSKIRFRFVPLDPKKVRPPPRNPLPQGNVYTITAAYLPSGGKAEPAQNVTVLLRYPAHATTILHLNGSKWTPLKAQNLPGSLQIYANTKQLGTFVAAGGRNNRVILWYITGGVCALAAALGLFLGLRERRRPPTGKRN